MRQRRRRRPDHAISRATNVVQVTSLTLPSPESVDVKEFEREILTALADRLRDDHGYRIRDRGGDR